jgi:UDP-galactopyranose mutase
MFDFLIVGAGFAGATIAERLASADFKVLLIDKRNHIGGNAYDFYNTDGLLIHKYGPHIFHTNSKQVYTYLSRFTDWRKYEHRVLANLGTVTVPFPINLDTINNLYGLSLSSNQLEDFFEKRAEKLSCIRTSEDAVISQIGRELYEKFYRGYTRKQWSLDPSELDASVASRIPVRTNKDGRYFTDEYQVMPLHGYTRMFEKMLTHKNIKLMLNTSHEDILNIIPYKYLVYTGPIDSYFNYCYGHLPYRSINFTYKTLNKKYFQDTGTINFPCTKKYTRITEFKYLTGQQHSKTTVVYEYPTAEGDPYYPIPREENKALYQLYARRAAQLSHTFFTGRLGTYKYYNMDQVVAQSLTLFKKLIHLIRNGYDTEKAEHALAS